MDECINSMQIALKELQAIEEDLNKDPPPSGDRMASHLKDFANSLLNMKRASKSTSAVLKKTLPVKFLELMDTDLVSPDQFHASLMEEQNTKISQIAHRDIYLKVLEEELLSMLEKPINE